MKYTLATATATLALTAAANAATVWQGDMFVATATSACGSAGINAGDFWQAIFAPKGLPGNNASSDQFALFHPHGFAAQIVPKSGTLDKAIAITLTTIRSDATTKINASAGNHSFTVSPPAPSTGTASVTISWTQTDWFTTGCNVTLNGVLVRRPGDLQL